MKHICILIFSVLIVLQILFLINTPKFTCWSLSNIKINDSVNGYRSLGTYERLQENSLPIEGYNGEEYMEYRCKFSLIFPVSQNFLFVVDDCVKKITINGQNTLTYECSGCKDCNGKYIYLSGLKSGENYLDVLIWNVKESSYFFDIRNDYGKFWIGIFILIGIFLGYAFESQLFK